MIAKVHAAATRSRHDADAPRARAGRWVFAAAAIAFAAVATPVVINGGLLGDDYFICMRPLREGYGEYLRVIWNDTGIVRPARFIELFLISKTCTTVPFGFAIAVPLALKFVSAFLLRGLLRDLDLRTPWPEIGAAIWLLEPVGTESALWPSALHVLLGLSLALVALRAFRRGAVMWGAIATVGAALSVEQALFAMPLAVWLVVPAKDRLRATAAAIVATTLVLVAYATWPGSNPRQAVSLADRVANVASEPEWYVFFPAVGLGLYSGAIAFVWALPWSVAIVAAGTLFGRASAPVLLAETDPEGLGRRRFVRGIAVTAVLVVLVNIPLIVTEVGYSARTFTPTWLVLAAAAAVGGSRVAWRHVKLVGALAGMFAAFALLSLALSVSVRVRTDTFDQAAARWIAARTHDGDVVAVCDVGRTVVDPAPLGAFHLHGFHSTLGDWIDYLTGRVVDVRRSGKRYWGSRCPNLEGADLVIRFPELVDAVNRSADP